MLRRLTAFALRGLILAAACLPTLAHADEVVDDKGAFDYTTLDSFPLSHNAVFVRGSIEGAETLLGKFKGTVIYLYDPMSGAFSASLTKQGTDGDQLYETVTGQFTPTGSFGKFKVVGGSGRFLKATGGGTFTGLWTNPGHTTAHVAFDGPVSRGKVGNYQSNGLVFFANLQGVTKQGGLSPYYATATGSLIGKDTQYGSIHNTTGLIPIDATTLIFEGDVGPNPFLPGNPKIHVIDTKNGLIYCTWTAVFTIKIINPHGDAILSGDGTFTIVGGTGHHQNASGTFATIFSTQTVPAGSNTAYANAHESGQIQPR